MSVHLYEDDHFAQFIGLVAMGATYKMEGIYVYPTFGTRQFVPPHPPENKQVQPSTPSKMMSCKSIVQNDDYFKQRLCLC